MLGIRTLAILIFCCLLAPPSVLAQETWSLQATPNNGEASHHNRLFEVGCDTASLAACTAVGTRSTSSIDYPVALRWDGIAWSYQPAALKIGASDTRLFGVDCPSATRCIAVGNYNMVLGSPGVKTLAEIWTGSSWSIQSTPVPSGATYSELTDVGCNNTAECKAVGYATVNGVKTAIAEKWKSPTWTLQSVPIPTGAFSSQLDGVACRWSNYCVAVGRYTASGGGTKSLAMFWDGTNWSLQTLTDPVGATQSTLHDVSCTGQPTVCMAVGGWKNSASDQFTLAYRFNGSSWTLQSTPNPSGSIASVFQDVSCKTTTSCAAVGSWVSGGGSNQTLAEDWNGSNWSVQSTPNPSGTSFNAFFGLECRTPGCLGVGYSTNSSGVNRTLSELRASSPKTHLTYSIGIGPPGLPQGWEGAVRSALEQWSWRTPLTFTRVNSINADLTFNWLGEYGNGQEFDGPGGKVVHAYGPLESLPGEIYFDQGESWTAEPRPGLVVPPIDIVTVAIDAIGHALGITSGTAYETYAGGDRTIPWSEHEAAVKKYGEHPDERRYFLRNSNSAGTPDIVFESRADDPDSEFSADWDGDEYDTVAWFEDSHFFNPEGDLWAYQLPHASGINTPAHIGDIFGNDYAMYLFGGDWNGDAKDQVGLYEGKEEKFYLYNNPPYKPNTSIATFKFGNDGWVPLIGDWNNDGIDSVGKYNGAGEFVLRNSNNAGPADYIFKAGVLSGDRPVAGDWNGDGKDTVGIYRPSTGDWLLYDDFNDSNPEWSFSYGNVGSWVGVVGDWNKDGIDTPGFAQD